MTVSVAKWTIDDYHQMIAVGLLDERRVELLKGDIVNMTPEGEPHAYSSCEAGEYLMQLLGTGATVRPAKPITLPNQSEPEPDLAIVQRLGREYLHHHPYPENIYWLIEYADTSLEKDLTLKTTIYAEVDIPEYWVVNLQKQQVTVFRCPEAGQYTEQTQSKTGVIYPLAFPDVAVSIESIISV